MSNPDPAMIASRSSRGPSSSMRRLASIVSRTPFSVSIAMLLLFILIILAAFAPQIATHDWTEQDLLARLSAPSLLDSASSHILGADHLGRDVFSRLLYALRSTLLISAAGVCVGVLVGATIGLLSGLIGGWFDNLVMLIVDAKAAIPLTLLAMVAAAVVGNSPIILVLVVGLADFGSYVRIVRADVLGLKQRPFIEAARSLGASPVRIALLHILPNLLSSIIVLATINFSYVVILESALSFLGVGVQPPETSLGQMVGEGRNYLISHWWLAAIPAATIVMITMTVSTLGDHLRDVLDPDKSN